LPDIHYFFFGEGGMRGIKAREDKKWGKYREKLKKEE
jgi:hypothetical protein